MPEVLKIENLHKSFDKLEVLAGIDLTLNKGETVVLVGASGSGNDHVEMCELYGNSTSGKIYLQQKLIGNEINGKMVYPEKELIPLRARVGMVFQHFNLFPHMTAIENVMEGPKTVLKLLSLTVKIEPRTTLKK